MFIIVDVFIDSSTINMRFFFITYILSLYIFSLSAQTRGCVIDRETSLPLSNVNIYVQKDSVVLCNTDKNGCFEIKHLNKVDLNDTIVFSYIGYQSIKSTLQKLNDNSYQVSMEEKSQRLQEIAVLGKKQNYFLTCVPLASLPVNLYSFSGFLYDGKIYVVAGDETWVRLAKGGEGTEALEFRSKAMYIYDIAHDEWTKKKQQVIPRSCHAAHLYKDKIFILGGVRYSTNRVFDYTDEHMEIYDLAKDTMYVDSVNPHQAVNFTSFIYGEYLYVIGGAVKERVYSDKIHVLDLKKGVWYEIGVIPEEYRRQMNGIVLGHTVYFFGGRRVAPLWDIVSYDLSTGEWKHLGELKEGVSYPGLAINGHLVYIYEKNMLQVYDVNDNSLRSFPVNIGMESAGLFYYKNKLYVVGGCSRNGIYISPTSGVYSIDIKQINTN